MKGFFPIWSAILVCLTGFCLIVMLLGFVCYAAGCENPRKRYLKKKRDASMTNPYYTPADRSIYMPHMRMPLTTIDQPDHLPYCESSPKLYVQHQEMTAIYEADETMIPLKSMNDLSEKHSIAADSRFYASEVSYSINKKLYSKAKKKHILEQL